MKHKYCHGDGDLTIGPQVDTPMGPGFHVDCSVCGPIATVHWETVIKKLVLKEVLEQYAEPEAVMD